MAQEEKVSSENLDRSEDRAETRYLSYPIEVFTALLLQRGLSALGADALITGGTASA